MMGRIPDDVVDQIRDGIPIETVIGEFIPLRKAGAAFKALCPFHDEKTPSFNVNPRMGIFKCFGCGVGGNAFQFLMRHEGLNFREAVQFLANRQGVDLSRYEGPGGEDQRPSAREKILAMNRRAADFFRASLRGAEGARARRYLAERGVSEEAEEAFQLGYAPARWDGLCRAAEKVGFSAEALSEAGLAVRREDGTGFYDRFRGRVMFPIQGPEGDVAGFGGRSLPGEEDQPGGAKYLNSAETAVFKKGRILYGFHQAREAIRSGKRVLVTEGYFDVISLWQGEVREAVAPLGTALTAEHLRVLRAHAEEIVFVFDPDAAGRAASGRAGDAAGSLLGLTGEPDMLVAGEVLRKSFISREGLGAVRLRVVNLPAGRDVDDLLRTEGPEKFEGLLERAEGLLDHTVRGALGEVGSAADQAEKVAAVRRLLPVLAACHQSVRDQYFALLEDQLGIPYPTVASMVTRMISENAKAVSHRGKPVEDLLGKEAVRPRVELDAARMILALPALAARPGVRPEAFRDPAVREIVATFREEAARGRSPTAAAMADRLKDPAARVLVAELAVDGADPEEAESIFSDCLDRLQERERLRMEKDLVKRLEQAKQKEGEDSPAFLRLLKEKNALLRERQRVGTPR